MASSRGGFDGRFQLDLFSNRDTHVNSKSVSDAPIVKVDNVAKCYGKWSLRGTRKVHALKGVSLQASAGEVFGLLGPNGAGKTTLVKVLLGVVSPTSGNAALFGQAAGSKFARSKIGYLPETLRVDRHHSARSALRLYGRLSSMSLKQIDKRSDELLEFHVEGRCYGFTVGEVKVRDANHAEMYTSAKDMPTHAADGCVYRIGQFNLSVHCLRLGGVSMPLQYQRCPRKVG